MRHIAEGTLRRLVDEPLVVSDRVVSHIAACARCNARRQEIAEDAQRATRLFSGPHLVPDVDREWHRFRRALVEPGPKLARWWAAAGPSWKIGSRRLSLRAGVLIAAAALVAGGTAAAATLATVFAPTHVAPVSLSRSDLQAVASVMGVGAGQVLGGFPSPSGSQTLSFGTISWSSSGPPTMASSLAQAVAQAGFPVALPTHLPAGVGSVQRFAVQPHVNATVSFAAGEGGVSGSTLHLVAGPAVLVEYGSTGGVQMPTLAVVTMPRPTATSSGASISQMEAFLLSRPGIPQQLAEEIRLLGDITTTLPVPVPDGASVHSVQVGGSPGILVEDPSNVASGVIWEDAHGMLHLVAGIIDSQDVLRVADQIG